jgi:hypothetical protein
LYEKLHGHMLKERPVFVDAADNAANRRMKPSEEQAQAKAFKEGRFKALLGAVAAGEVGTTSANGASGASGGRVVGLGSYDDDADWEDDNDDDNGYDEGYDLADDNDDEDDDFATDYGDASLPPVAVPMHTGDLDDVIAARRPRGLRAPAVRKNKKFSSRRVR